MAIITKLSDCIQVQFTCEEMIDIFQIAQTRNENKTVHNVASYVQGNELTQYEKHIIGAYGEYAVALDLGLDIDRDLYYKGDGGIDFEFKGKTIDVKTTSGKSQLLTFKRKDKFQADIAILAQIISPNCVKLLSCTSRDNFALFADEVFDGSVSLRTDQMDRYINVFHKEKNEN